LVLGRKREAHMCLKSSFGNTVIDLSIIGFLKDQHMDISNLYFKKREGGEDLYSGGQSKKGNIART
jgi:hypothetical protein